MDFSKALVELKQGKKLQRSGWNGKGMYVVMQKGYPAGIAINANTAQSTGLPEGSVCKFAPYLMIKNVNDSFATWVPSITDLFSEDWEVVA